jgi:hypothetical protein
MVGAACWRGVDLQDTKAGEAFGLLPVDLDVLHVRSRRARPAPVDQPVDRGAGSFEDGLDASVTAVPDPSRDAFRARLLARTIAEEHSLHDAAHHDASANYT